MAENPKTDVVKNPSESKEHGNTRSTATTYMDKMGSSETSLTQPPPQKRRKLIDADHGDIVIPITAVDAEEAKRIIAAEDCYSMTRRARAIIVNMEHNREGSEVDANKLSKLFKDLDFDVITDGWKNLTYEGLRDSATKEAANTEAHDKVDAFIFVIMSHGYEGHITCSDGVDMQLETLYEKFDGKRCKGLIRKPKIFIIQACRGWDTTEGFSSADSDQVDGGEAITHEKDDFIIAFSVVSDYSSFRYPTLGTVFLDELVTTIRKKCHVDHFLDMLLEVNREVAKRNISFGEQPKCKQIPQAYFTITKKIYFLPKIPRVIS